MSREHMPKRGDRVHAKGHTGEFIVLRIDKRAGVADLGLTGADSVEYRIPLAAIEVIREHMNQAAAPIVPEATEKN